MTDLTSLQINLTALFTLTNKEIFRFLRIWSQTLFPPVITMSLYFLIFGKFIGAQIEPIAGFTYIQYIVPGLILMAIMTNAYSNTASSFFLMKFNKSIEELLVAPMSNFVILIGFMLGGMARGLGVGAIVFLISFLFTHVPIAHPGLVLLISALTSAVFSLGGIINGIYAKRFDDISFLPIFILTPLTYLGGVFYSIHQLPPPWRTISKFNPILTMVDAARFAILGVSDFSIYWGLLLISGLFFILFGWGWYLLHKGTGIKV